VSSGLHRRGRCGDRSRGSTKSSLPGVVHFDVARSLTDPDSFVVTEVFEDRRALERRNAQSEVAHVLSLVEAGALVGEMEWTVWETSRDSG